MKNKLFKLVLLLVLLIGTSVPQASAQSDFGKCVSNVRDRIDDLPPTDPYTFKDLRDFVKKYPYGDIPKVVNDLQKSKAFKRVFTSLSNFCDLCPTLSGKGMKGYIKQARVLIDPLDDTKTISNLQKFEQAFTKGGSFKGPNFDEVMSQLADELRFDFDPSTGTFTSKVSGAKYAKHPAGSYGVQGGGFGGESDAISHIMRGHTPNDLNAGGAKSVFDDAAKVFDYIDMALKAPVASRVPKGGRAFEVDLASYLPPNTYIGQVRGANGGQMTNTTKILVAIRDGTSDVIHSAYPN